MVSPTSEQYVVDQEGRRVAVIIPIALYQRLLDALEEPDDIRVLDEAKAAGDEAIPFEQAVEEIERGRRWPIHLRLPGGRRSSCQSSEAGRTHGYAMRSAAWETTRGRPVASS